MKPNVEIQAYEDKT